MANIEIYEPLFGTFKINNLLGTGGFGEVYEVSNKGSGSRMELKRAIKIVHVPDGEKLDKIIREIDTVLQIGEHENIVRIDNYEYKGNHLGSGGDLLILMELLTGLTSILQKGQLPVEETVKLGIHICKALEACSENKIVHRDVKPANILKGKNGIYKLSDFGIARNITANMSSHAGTIEFEAPEVYLRKPYYDARADIYSLGVTLYYLLNGNKLPPELEDLTRRLIDKERPPTLSNEGIPKVLSDIVLKACEYEQTKRYQSAREMREDLEKIWTYKKNKELNYEQKVKLPRIKKNIDFAEEIVQGKKRNVQFGGYNWRVLDVQGDRALLLTEDIIEKRCYNTELTGVTWETCTLRKYLNGEFFRKFNSQEQARIIEVNNVNKNNQWFGTEGGNNTKDKIFLLSIEETVKYFGDSGQLKNKNPKSKYDIDDEYNKDRIAKYENEELWWWLRSPGLSSDGAASVNYYGSLDLFGSFVYSVEVGVRPALWLNLKSEIF